MNRFCKFALFVAATSLSTFAAFAAPNTVQFDPTSYTVNENAGTVTVNVTAERLGDSSDQITVTYTTRDGTAKTADGDYVSKTGTITFGPGETFKQISVTVTNDNVLENAENFFIDLSDPQGASIDAGSDTATVTIADDDSGSSSFQFSSANYSVNEGDGTVTITVVRSGGVQLVASVSYATDDGTAQSGADYTAVAGTLTFDSGETSKTFAVPIINDSFVENSENFRVRLSSPSFGSDLGSPSTAIVTIVDNDGGSTVRFNPENYTVNEAAGTVTLTVIADRLGNASDQITVDYATRNGSAVSPGDYTAKTGTILFGSGETQKQITIAINNDITLENIENFFVDLSNPQGASLNSDGSATATVNIADDDTGTSTIQFSSASYTVNEGAGSVALTVVRSGGIQFAVSANFSTANGSAVAGSDYTAASGSVNFAAGETQKTIFVGVNEDSFAEGDETFTVNLSNPSAGATLGQPSTATVTIVDNDGGSTVQFNPATYTVNEANGQVILNVTANRLGDATVQITVQYATRNGSAVAGQDYISQTGTLVFGNGETQKQIGIAIVNDTLLENPENFFVDLSNPQNASLKADGSNTATITIADDDSGPSTIRFSSAAYSVNENAGSVALTVVRSGGIQLTASADYSTADGSAEAGSDYTATSGTVSFAPGETQKTIVVPISDDALIEGDENFSVSLANPKGAGALGSPSTAVVTVVDNDGGATPTPTATATPTPTAPPTVPAPTGPLYESDFSTGNVFQFTTTTSGTVAKVKFASGFDEGVRGLAFDHQGNLFIGENDRITKIAANGTRTVFASNLQGPNFLTVNRAGNLFATDRDGNVLRFTAQGAVSVFASGLGKPTGLAFDANEDLFVAETSGNVIFKITSAGAKSVFASNMKNPQGLVFDRQGFLYVANNGNGTIERFTPLGSRFLRVVGLASPIGLAFDNNSNLFVADNCNGSGTNSILKFTPTAQTGAVFASGLGCPLQLAFEPPRDPLLNISTRARVEPVLDRELIGGFIITGNEPKTILLRVLGPSLANFGVQDPLLDPILELHTPDGVVTNDNWMDTQKSEIQASGIAPNDNRESAILVTLPPGSYTAVVRGKAPFVAGTALVEVYDGSPTANATLANISSRGYVQSGDNRMIAGVIVGGGNGAGKILVRGLGPSLAEAGIVDPVSNPTLSLRNANGTEIARNDNWTDTQPYEVYATGIPPTNGLESAIVVTLASGAYTAILGDVNNDPGVGLIEVYNLR
jgi:sugar lactone lactonase YvrE